jgi:hypothetical protein
MNRPAIVVAAVVVFAMAVANIVLGRNLIMPLAAAQERGAGMPWYIVWTMIGLTVLSGIALGVFLISSLMGKAGDR